MKSVVVALGLAVALALANYWVLGQLGGPTLCGPCAAILLGGPFVLALALAGILPALAAPAAPTPVAAKPAPALAKPSEPPEHTALRLLASLQEDGRLVDFLTEDDRQRTPTSRSARPRAASTAPVPRRCAPA